MKKKKTNSPMKTAILFVHGASYSNYANSIDIFEQKLHKDFKDWKKVPNEKAEYCFQKNKLTIDIFFYKWRERTPKLSEWYILSRFSSSLRTFNYFLFGIKWRKDNIFLHLFIFIGAFALFLALLISFGISVYSISKDYLDIQKFYEIFKSFTFIIFALIFIFRFLYPHQEIMNLAFLFFAYDTNTYADGVDFKDHLLAPLERLIQELIENKSYSKILLVGQSMGGVLLSDTITNLECGLQDHAAKEAIKSKLKLVTAGSPHGLFNSSITDSKILDSTNWDYHFCKKDFLHTLIPEKHAQRIELPFKKIWIFTNYFESYHLRYLREINYKEELNL